MGPRATRSSTARHRALAALALVVSLFVVPLVALPARGQEPPPPRVKVTAFKVDGNTLLTEAEIRAVVARYEGKTFTLPELKNVADALTRVYQGKGWFTVRVLVPTQEVSADGVVHLAVAQNKIGRFNVTGNRFYSARVVRNFFDDALKDPYPDRAKFERAVMLLNELIGMKASTVIEPGQAPDTVDVTIEVHDRNPLRFGVDYNNYGSAVNGYDRPGATVRWGNLTGNADELTMHGFTTLTAKSTVVGVFNYGLPVDHDGTRLNTFYTNSAFAVGGDLQPLDIRGSASIYGMMVTHPFIRSTTQNLDFQGGFIIQNIHNYLEGFQTSRDNLRELQAGFTSDFNDPNGRWFCGSHVTQDLGTTAGGMRPNDPQSSRAAGGGFFKWTIDAARVQRLTAHSFLLFRGSQQYPFEPLPTAEQVSLGGVDSVRGYRQAAYLGDGGYNLSLEYRLDLLTKSPDVLQAVAFVDHGGAYVMRPSPGELSSLSLTGTGLGFRFHPNEDITLNFDLGLPLGTNAVTRTQGRSLVPYIFFSYGF